MINVAIQKPHAGPETCYSNNLGFALSDSTWGWHLKKVFGSEIFFIAFSSNHNNWKLK